MEGLVMRKYDRKMKNLPLREEEVEFYQMVEQWSGRLGLHIPTVDEVRLLYWNRANTLFLYREGPGLELKEPIMGSEVYAIYLVCYEIWQGFEEPAAWYLACQVAKAHGIEVPWIWELKSTCLVSGYLCNLIVEDVVRISHLDHY